MSQLIFSDLQASIALNLCFITVSCDTVTLIQWLRIKSEAEKSQDGESYNCS